MGNHDDMDEFQNEAYTVFDEMNESEYAANPSEIQFFANLSNRLVDMPPAFMNRLRAYGKLSFGPEPDDDTVSVRGHRIFRSWKRV